jgi:SH3-like domain-containing protein
VSIGSNARVTINDGVSLRLRNNPGISGQFVAKLSEGTVFKILDGPKCLDGYSWWKIQINDETGWVAEGDNNDYFIEPWK